MTAHKPQPIEVSVRQFAGDSGSVTRGLRQGREYILTLGGAPLATVTPIKRRRSVPKEEFFAIFAGAPQVDPIELKADIDRIIDNEPHDPLEGTDL